jgi:hypothetical protein
MLRIVETIKRFVDLLIDHQRKKGDTPEDATP